MSKVVIFKIKSHYTNVITFTQQKHVIIFIKFSTMS